MKTTIRSKRHLSPIHVAAFYKVLERIGKHIVLDWSNIHKQFSIVKWPKRDDVEYTFAAVDSASFVKYLPFQTTIGIVGPPTRVSLGMGTMEFRIYDDVSRLTAEMFKCNTPVSLCVLQDGREVLFVPGLTLDSIGEKTEYPERSLQTDKLIIRQNMQVFELLRNLIADFPANDDLTRRCQSQALEDMSGSMRPMYG